MTFSSGAMEQELVRRERWPGDYDAQGTPLVRPGQEVAPDQPVLRLERFSPSAQSEQRVHENGYVAAAQTEVVPSGLHGRVVDITRRGGVIIESRAAVVRGVLGVGNQVAGVLTLWQSGMMESSSSIPTGAILIVPGPLNFTFLRQALLSGINGLVASSIELRDLEGFLRVDLISLLDSVDQSHARAYLPPITLCLTEGLGTLTMPVHITNLLSQHQGEVVLLSGTTSPRQNLFPDLLISLPHQEARSSERSEQPSFALSPGVSVRVSAGEHEGKIGTLDYIFLHQQVFSSGMRERAARIRCDDGSLLVLPLVLLERSIS